MKFETIKVIAGCATIVLGLTVFCIATVAAKRIKAESFEEQLEACQQELKTEREENREFQRGIIEAIGE